MTHQFLQRGLHQCLAFRIQRRGRFVKQQQWRVAQDGARNGDALALAARQCHAALAERRLETGGQPADEFGGMREICGALDLGIAGLGPAEADVVAGGSREHHRILRHQGDMRANQFRIGRFDRHAVERNHASRGVVEAQQQMKQCALAGARGTDDRDLFARTHRERNTVDGGHARS